MDDLAELERLAQGVRTGNADDVIEFLEAYRKHERGRLRGMRIEWADGTAAVIRWETGGDGREK